MPDDRLASERVVVEAPMSFTGSARRTWKLTRLGPAWLKILTVPTALMIIVTWWMVIVAWYLVFGLLVVPYRLLRRGSRKRKKAGLQHQEMLAAVRRGPRP